MSLSLLRPPGSQKKIAQNWVPTAWIFPPTDQLKQAASIFGRPKSKVADLVHYTLED